MDLAQVKGAILSKATDAELLLRKFKQKISDVNNLIIKVGIPKEVEVSTEAINYSQEKKQIARAGREKMSDVILGTKLNEQKLKQNEEQYVADIAWKNNEGSFSEKIPARAFGSTMIRRYSSKIQKLINKEMKAYTEGQQSLEEAYNRIGLACAGYMKDNLTNGNWQANAPLTIFLKGSRKPLIDTGQMRQSITYIVKDKNSE
jgi:hypothetical protein